MVSTIARERAWRGSFLGCSFIGSFGKEFARPRREFTT
ncbi:hypothetical protein GWL_21630 [Herbaspirillum sp. GW103]|nr:hypothetical protein GWL_21630 [Herbaspirillum sp. GW103]